MRLISLISLAITTETASNNNHVYQFIFDFTSALTKTR